MLKRSETVAGLSTAGLDVDYRPDIDGLRAISILAVVWYHAFPALVPGGFIGVDVFFVISGFLITRIITKELATGSFSALSFYRRRIRRIFPALIVVLAAVYAIGWFVLMPRDFADLGKNIIGGAAFFANLLQLQGRDYFAPDASTNPLLHLWSLGIEEQFYIFWPLLLVVLAGHRRRSLIIAGIAAASLVANLALVWDHQTFAFYSPITRAWELLAGALIAHQRTPLRIVSADVKGVAGLLLIALPIALLDHTSKYPGVGALLPVVGAGLLIDARGSFVSRQVLAHPAMVFIGLISYPLYLWHWPLLSYLGILRDSVPNFLEKDLAVFAAFALASATYLFVERPLRHSPRLTLRLTIAMCAVAVVGFGTMRADGLIYRFPPAVSDIATLPAKENAGFRPECFLESSWTSADRRSRCVESGAGPLVFIWGDSTAAALYPGLKKAQQGRTFRIAQFTAPACSPIGGTSNASCEALNADALNAISATHPDIVLLHAMWDDNTDLAALRAILTAVKSAGAKRAVIIGPVPFWKRSLPFMLVNAYRLQHRLPRRIASGVSGVNADRILFDFSKAEGVEYVSAWKQLCTVDGCLTRVGDAPTDVVIWDQVHLSNAGSEYLGRAIVDHILSGGAD